MANDLFEQLAESPIPPPPVELDALVHARLNKRLLAGQLTDLALRGLPYAMLQFGQAVTALLRFTATGQYEAKRRRRQA